MYFYQFVEQAERHDLQYLAEADLHIPSEVQPQTLQMIREKYTSLIELEQALDFLENRAFRRTLLCHAQVPLTRRIKPDIIRNFSFSSYSRPVSEEPILPLVSVEMFIGEEGAKLSIDHPLSKAAMLCLSQSSPAAFSFDELVQSAQQKLEMDARFPYSQPEDPQRDMQVLGANLLRAFSCSRSLVNLHTFAYPLAHKVGIRPETGEIIRYQARHDSRVTNLRHERLRMDEMDRFLLYHLDGSRDIPALVDLVWHGPVADGRLEYENDGQELTDQEKHNRLEEFVHQKLFWFAQNAFLSSARTGD
jgi:methyltransferase-like protein